MWGRFEWAWVLDILWKDRRGQSRYSLHGKIIYTSLFGQRPDGWEDKWDQEQIYDLLGQSSPFSHFLCFCFILFLPHRGEIFTWSSPVKHPTDTIWYGNSWRVSRISIFHWLLSLGCSFSSPEPFLPWGACSLSFPGSHDPKTDLSGWRWTKRMIAIIGNRTKIPYAFSHCKGGFVVEPPRFCTRKLALPWSPSGGSPASSSWSGITSFLCRRDEFLKLHYYPNY